MTQDGKNEMGVNVTGVPEAEPSDIDTQVRDLIGLGVKIDGFATRIKPGASAMVTRASDGALHAVLNFKAPLGVQRSALTMVHRIARDEIHLAPGDTIDLMPK